MTAFDALIVGGGHNGLVCAAYLARAGKKVGVFERRPVLGGAVLTEELWPGFHLSVASYWMSLLQPKIMLDLELARYGLRVLSTPPGIHVLADGACVTLPDDPNAMAAQLRRYSDADAANYPAYAAHMRRLSVHVRRLLFEIPVDVASGKAKDWAKSIGLLWRLRGAGSAFYDLWDLLTLSCHDFLKRWFSHPDVLSLFASYASGSGGNLGPMSPGSAYVLARPFLRDGTTAAGPGGLPQGGMGAITQALTGVCRDLGVQLYCDSTVEEIVVERQRARGIRLAGGEVIRANTVVSNAHAKTLFLHLLRAADLPHGVLDAVGRMRTQSSCFKINLALSALPQWSAVPAGSAPPGSITIAHSLHTQQHAFEQAQRGDMADNFYLWMLTPSAFDPALAPPGKHCMSLLGGHVPYQLADGRAWDEATKDELLARVCSQIERHAPGFGDLVLHHQVLTPPDIEQLFGMHGGHVHHAEMSLDQLFFRRPIAHYADYRTPIAGLYQCGASTHPGGGVTGVPGHNAAKVVLRDKGK